jgi:alkanesulfonate monooxygenase SsuD/methylene tetrahydromethanopterin reductase-like flavin-dependent oxidoreductase (luciferase family)
MMDEALDIILRVWTEPGPWRIDGKFWTVDMPGWSDEWRGPHLHPLQEPHPPLADGVRRRFGERNAKSRTAVWAVRHGAWIPQPLEYGQCGADERGARRIGVPSG